MRRTRRHRRPTVPSMGKPPIAALVSFRLGGTDGVSVESRKWQWALEQLGFEVRRVAGEIAGPALPHDVVLPALAIAPPDGVPALTADDVLNAIRPRPNGRRRERVLLAAQSRSFPNAARGARSLGRTGRLSPPRSRMAARDISRILTASSRRVASTRCISRSTPGPKVSYSIAASTL